MRIILEYYVNLSLLFFIISKHIIRAICLDLFFQECSCRKKREILLDATLNHWESNISSEATLKEREQIADMVSSTVSDIDHIDLEGVNHVVIEFSMINKL